VYQTMVGISAGTIANGFSRLLVRLMAKKDLIKLENNDVVEKMLQENRFDNDMMIVFIQPAIEEIIFRGIIQPGIQFGLQQLDISSDLAKAISFLSTDIAFAAIHSGQPSKFAALVGGLAYGSLALKYEGNIIPSAIAHMTYNFISIFKYR